MPFYVPMQVTRIAVVDWNEWYQRLCWRKWPSTKGVVQPRDAGIETGDVLRSAPEL